MSALYRNLAGRCRGLFLSAAVLAGALLAAPAQACKSFETAEQEADIADIDLVRIEWQRGDIVVEADETLRAAVISIDKCAHRKQERALVGLRVIPDGRLLRVATDIGNRPGKERLAGKITLSLRVPPSQLVEIRQKEGDLVASGLAGLAVIQGEGDATIHSISDTLIVVRDEGGLLDVRDSADIDIRYWSGKRLVVRDVESVRIEGAGDGEIEITGVAAGVGVGVKTDGDIDIENVGGDVLIGSLGRSNVRVTGIGGSVGLSQHQRGNVRWASVEGDVMLPRGHPDTPE